MGQAESRQEQFWEACGFGHIDKVRQLIDEGIDVNWVSKTHDSSPIHAASQGKPEIVKLLIEAGCDVNVRDERQCTALHHACMNGFTSCVELLIQAGSVVNVQDKNKWTPLHNAAYWGHADVADILIAHKADVTVKNKDERLAIHEAARSRSKDEGCVGRTAQSLIDAGSDVEARAGTDGFSDFTVLMFASYHGHISVVQNLLDARCEVNAQSSNKWTALHWAADRSHANVVELLLENEADTSISGDRSENARDRARCDDVRAIFDRVSSLIKPKEVVYIETDHSHHQPKELSNGAEARASVNETGDMTLAAANNDECTTPQTSEGDDAVTTQLENIQSELEDHVAISEDNEIESQELHITATVDTNTEITSAEDITAESVVDKRGDGANEISDKVTQ